ncbi:hypothetical protein PR048_000868 [Dryococelus australis]|uniref:Uncharacterized protein n=1 Tax=Dryococelus australis TaxID=614101 RepID=A0ABQ9IFT8_9NEOP|nr:hypothetical protein PR048_000868 [Dryococelus australis]
MISSCFPSYVMVHRMYQDFNKKVFVCTGWTKISSLKKAFYDLSGIINNWCSYLLSLACLHKQTYGGAGNMSGSQKWFSEKQPLV